MGEANIVSFQTAVRARAGVSSYAVTEAELRQRQRAVPLEDCHVALERVSIEFTTRTKRFSLFHDLSAVFPKGRRIVVLGHKGSGKTVLFDLMLRTRAPTRGAVLGRSRLSWPVHSTGFLDQRLSVRQNAIFVSRVLGVDARTLLATIQRFCDFSDRQLSEKVKAIANTAKRRIGAVVVLAADFDCHLIDSVVKASHFGFDGPQADALEATLFGRDYVFGTSNVKHIPGNCDLAYILYDGRLYFFDDITLAAEIYEQLPIPVDPGGARKKREEDEDDDEPASEDGF